MNKIIDSLLRKLSGWFQSSDESFKRHNSQYEAEGSFEWEREAGRKNLETNFINSSEIRLNDLLAQHPAVKTAVDIGSGTGWSAAALSSLVDNVIALEPSTAALDISKQLYPETQYKNIVWMQGLAEDILSRLKLSIPTVFLTGCVLSHLRDAEVVKICTAINAIAPRHSVISFAECWGDLEKHQIMWHIRTKEWWQKALPEWELDFHGPLHERGDCHMGIWGVKK